MSRRLSERRGECRAGREGGSGQAEVCISGQKSQELEYKELKMTGNGGARSLDAGASTLERCRG